MLTQERVHLLLVHPVTKNTVRKTQGPIFIRGKFLSLEWGQASCWLLGWQSIMLKRQSRKGTSWFLTLFWSFFLQKGSPCRYFLLSQSASTLYAGVAPKPLCSSSVTPTTCVKWASFFLLSIEAESLWISCCCLIVWIGSVFLALYQRSDAGNRTPVLQPLTDEGWNTSKTTALAPAQGQQVALQWRRNRYYRASWKGGWALWLGFCSGRKKPGFSLCNKIHSWQQRSELPTCNPKTTAQDPLDIFAQKSYTVSDGPPATGWFF